MANTETNLSEQPSRTLSISDKTGTDPYATKSFESKIYKPDYVVLPGTSEDGNIPSPSGSGQTEQNTTYTGFNK
jgi:hypothetical protein